MTAPILLATTSKYKKALFNILNLPYDCAAPPYEEIIQEGADPIAAACELAAGKAQSLGELYPHHLIIGTDQVLALGSKIFTKPNTTEKAVKQLLELSGKTHCLHSAFHLYQPQSGIATTQCVTASLTFHAHLSPQYLKEMVEADQSQDCVGGYKYESRGIFLMEKIETPDTNAIVGLPLIALIEELQKLGYFPNRFNPGTSSSPANN